MKKVVVVLAVLVLAAPVFAAGIKVAAGDATPAGQIGASSRGVVAYSNVTTQTGYRLNQGGLEDGDDLFMTQGGELESFKFSYYVPATAPAVTEAVIRFYEQDPNTGEVGALIALYDIYSGLPGNGGWIINQAVDPGTILPADVWMTVQFDVANCGQLLFNPPTIGTSYDVFAEYDGAAWGYWYLGTTVISDFALEVTLTPEPASMLLLGLAGLLIRRR